jgi:hypothetical protein
MIEFTKNAASTHYVIFVNQNCSDPLRRSAANTRLLAAGALTRLTGFVLDECIGAFRRCSLTFATLVRSCGSAADIEGAEIPRCSCWVLCAHGQVTTIELNEPVAPEFRDILPDELFQTVEKLFRSSRHVFRHATPVFRHATPLFRHATPA